jgi:CubicO group peptidase (beta-lactamase class C family)
MQAIPANGVAEDGRKIAHFVESVGKQAVEIDKVVGLSIGVASGDEVLVAEGFGLASVELNVPATANTVYRIGSITKEFTAAAVLILVEDGRIHLDAPLTEYLPDYPIHGCSFTIRQLLQHTSGVPDFTRLPNYRQERPLDVSRDQVLNRFQNLPLEFQPGEKHRYCNSGYFLLGMVVEQASGKSYREFVENRLFRKLGMRQTYCDSSSTIIPQRAAGYSRWGGALRNAPHIGLSQTVGAGNIASTATDLILWQRGLVTHRLLRTESAQLMTTRGKLNNGKSFNYGFGIRIASLDSHKVIRHGGGISGFRSDLAYYPDSGLTIAVVANCDHANAKKISDRIARYILNKHNRQEE